MMKNLLIIVFLIFLSSQNILASTFIGETEDPSKIGVGARPMGMGKAFVAIVDDVNAIFMNPAGLAGKTDWQATSMYTTLLGDVHYITGAFSFPFRMKFFNGSLGLGYIGSSVSNIIKPSQSGFSYFGYYNNLLILSAGTLYPSNEKLSLGLNLKIFQEGYAGSVASFGRGVDLDLGLKYPLRKDLNLAINFQNILPYAWGARVTWQTGKAEGIPSLTKIGLAGKKKELSLAYALDYDFYSDQNRPNLVHLGLEKELNRYLTLRGGLDQTPDAGGVASNLTLGIGLRLGKISFDYAYHPYYGETGSLTHYFSVSFSGQVFSDRVKYVEELEN